MYQAWLHVGAVCFPYASGESCAAIRIQTAYRRYRAAEAFQELAAFRFWNELDHFEEKDALVNNRQV